MYIAWPQCRNNDSIVYSGRFACIWVVFFKIILVFFLTLRTWRSWSNVAVEIIRNHLPARPEIKKLKDGISYSLFAQLQGVMSFYSNQSCKVERQRDVLKNWTLCESQEFIPPDKPKWLQEKASNFRNTCIYSNHYPVKHNGKKRSRKLRNSAEIPFFPIHKYDNELIW